MLPSPAHRAGYRDPLGAVAAGGEGFQQEPREIRIATTAMPPDPTRRAAPQDREGEGSANPVSATEQRRANVVGTVRPAPIRGARLPPPLASYLAANCAPSPSPPIARPRPHRHRHRTRRPQRNRRHRHHLRPRHRPNRNRCAIVANSNTASCVANRAPIHPRGPPPNGK